MSSGQTYNIRVKQELVAAIEAELDTIRRESFGTIRTHGEAVRWLAMEQLKQRQGRADDPRLLEAYKRIADLERERADIYAVIVKGAKE